MADKKKPDDTEKPTPDAKPAEKVVSKKDEKPALVPTPAKVPAPKPQKAAAKPKKVRKATVGSLAASTGTRPVVLACMKAAYRWTEKKKMTRPEFLRKRDEWLARPASEV